MFRLLIVFFFLIPNFLASGLPLGQVLPLQTCPCNQNSYTDSMTVPLVYQQPMVQGSAPQQYVQPSVLQPANNLYNQPLMVQNQMAPYQIQQPNLQNYQDNPSNSLSNQLSKMYLNKFRSNPSLQGILDPNSKVYGLPGLGNAADIPQVVNNYYIVSPDSVNNDEIGPAPLNIEDIINELIGTRLKPLDNNQMRRKPNKEIKERRNANNNRGTNRRSNDRNNTGLNTKGNTPRNNNNNVNRNRQQTPRRGNKENIASKNNRPNMGPNGRQSQFQGGKSKQTNRNQPRKSQASNSNKNKSNNQNAGRSKNISYAGEASNVVAEKVKPKNERKNNIKTNATSTSKPKSKKTKNNESIFPGISDDTMNSLMTSLRRQMQDQQNQKSNSKNVLPFNYEQLFEQSNLKQPKSKPKERSNRKSGNKSSKRKSNLRKRTRQRNEKAKNSTTTEKQKISRPKVKNNKANVTITENSLRNIKNKTVTAFPKLKAEGNKSDVNHTLPDDYYPDFRNDKMYYESNEIYNVRNLRDNRYYYTTDRNYEMDVMKPNTNANKEITQKQVQHNNESNTENSLNRLPKVNTTESTKNDTSKTSSNASKKPKTKPLVKVNEKVNNKVLDKSSSYSNAKTTRNKNSKNYQKNEITKKPDAGIETVYARSKVAKYNNDDNFENETPVVTYYLPDNMEYIDDGKTVIVAKSIPVDHFW